MIKIDPIKVATKQREARIVELKALLADSDYKVLPDYDKTNSTITAQRQAWRDEIRTLEQA
jgi:hypothetical protein